MGQDQLRWLTQAATLTYIAGKLSEIDPCDPIYRCCTFCMNSLGFDNPAIAHKDTCAWKKAKEFMSQ